jgi:hypothetical protein
MPPVHDNDHDILIRLDTRVEAMERRLIHVEKLTGDLNRTANLGKGALALLIGVGTAAGWLIHFVIDKLRM